MNPIHLEALKCFDACAQAEPACAQAEPACAQAEPACALRLSERREERERRKRDIDKKQKYL